MNKLSDKAVLIIVAVIAATLVGCMAVIVFELAKPEKLVNYPTNG